MEFEGSDFHANLSKWCLRYLLWNSPVALRWLWLDLNDDDLTLEQVVAWGCPMALAVRQQAITWANVDLILCCHMASLGHNELIQFSAGTNNHINGCMDTELLTLNMLKFWRLWKMYSHFVSDIWDFVQQKTKFTMEQPYVMPILYCQYHGRWCPGDLSCQGTSRHGIDQISWNILSLAPGELSYLFT